MRFSMSMVGAKMLADEMGLDVADIRRIARQNKFTRYKDGAVELYDTADWESFGKKLKPRKLSASHKKKLSDANEKRREAQKKNK